MSKYATLLLVLVYQINAITQDKIVSYGIPDTVLEKEFVEVSKYRSQIDYPSFIGWTLDSKKMLFNGGKVIYSMKTHKSEIIEYIESDQNVSSYLSPNHKYFLYQQDENGNENYQLFLYNISLNISTPLSKKGDKTYDPFWSSDNHKMAYKSNKENAARIDLYIKSVSGKSKDNLVFKNFSDDGQIYDWSSDKNLILAVKVI